MKLKLGMGLELGTELIGLLKRAGAEQGAGNSAAALALYETALPQLTREEHPDERALALYDELLLLAPAAKDQRAHGLAVAMRGQLVFMRGEREAGLAAMVGGLEVLLACGAEETEHLTCHTRYLGRRLKREVYEQCVNGATEDKALRLILLAAEGC